MKTIKIGLIGLGRLGERHAENLAQKVSGCCLAALCDMNPDKLNTVADRLGVSTRVQSFDELIAIAELDAVAIASPSCLHLEHIGKALAAGKHVFCEKPLGVSAQECRDAVDIVQRYPDRKFMVGFMRRFDSSYLWAKQVIDSGELGRVVLFRSYSQDPEKYIDGAIAFAPGSGGQFLDMAVHDIDLLRWLTGSEPEAVWALGGCYAHPEFAATNDGDNVSALLKMRDDSMCFLFAGRTAPHGYNVETEIIGTKTTLRISSVPHKNLVEIIDAGGVRRECFDNFLARFADSYIREMQYFVSCLLNDTQPCPGVVDGARAAHIAYECRAAFEGGTVVTIDPRS